MKPTHKVVNNNNRTNWKVGTEIVFQPALGIGANGDAMFTDTTGTVCIGANLKEVEKI
jgi:hypothetical protein